MPFLTLPSREVGLLSKEVLDRSSSLRLRATGGSMNPVIQHEDILRVAPKKTANRLGDILLFQNEAGRIIAHRVIGRNASQHYLMRGDANSNSDGWITDAQILGIVTGIERNGKVSDFNTFRFRYVSSYRVLRKNLRRKLAAVLGQINRGINREKGFNRTTVLSGLFGYLQHNRPGEGGER